MLMAIAMVIVDVKASQRAKNSSQQGQVGSWQGKAAQNMKMLTLTHLRRREPWDPWLGMEWCHSASEVLKRPLFNVCGLNRLP